MIRISLVGGQIISDLFHPIILQVTANQNQYYSAIVFLSHIAEEKPLSFSEMVSIAQCYQKHTLEGIIPPINCSYILYI